MAPRTQAIVAHLAFDPAGGLVVTQCRNRFTRALDDLSRLEKGLGLLQRLLDLKWLQDARAEVGRRRSSTALCPLVCMDGCGTAFGVHGRRRQKR